MNNNSIHEETIGELSDGRPIVAYTLSNDSGLRATFLNYGGILVELEVPDKIGLADDITLGLDDIEQYVNANKHYFGALVGRFANRIAGGKCTIGGKKLRLDVNEEANKNHLHGGANGFSFQLFEGRIEESATGEVLVFEYHSPDGEGGYPGNLKFTARIRLTPENGLRYEYEATTDAPTIVNFTCHPYFNLSGEGTGSIRQHWVQIIADQFLPNNDHNVPTGALESVSDGPFDFRQPQSLDQRLDSPNPQVLAANGFDHTFVLAPDRDPRKPVAIVTDESSGRKLEVFTSEPGVQFYTGNSLDGTLPGKNDFYYPKHAGFCLETQHFPDSPNQKDFPSTLLKPGKPFKSFTEYRFSTI